MKTIERAALNCNKEYSLQPAPAYLGFIQGVKFAQEWISVDAELPEIGEKVFTKMAKDKRTSYGIATRIREEWEINAHWIDHTFSNMNITHWRPIELK